MREKYFPPTYKSRQFHCVHCGVFANQVWRPVYIHPGSGVIDTGISACQCAHCLQWSHWLDGESRIILPLMPTVETPHPDLPEDCRSEYAEARDIFGRSPRAAAALLRLAIQKLMTHLGEKGKNINEDIGALVAKGLPAPIQQALDVCRVVGNNAVHPGEINLDDSPEIAQELFGLINFIVDDRITRPKEVAALYARLPQNARAAIEKRDASSIPPPA